MTKNLRPTLPISLTSLFNFSLKLSTGTRLIMIVITGGSSRNVNPHNTSTTRCQFLVSQYPSLVGNTLE